MKLIIISLLLIVSFFIWGSAMVFLINDYIEKTDWVSKKLAWASFGILMSAIGILLSLIYWIPKMLSQSST